MDIRVPDPAALEEAGFAPAAIARLRAAWAGTPAAPAAPDPAGAGTPDAPAAPDPAGAERPAAMAPPPPPPRAHHGGASRAARLGDRLMAWGAQHRRPLVRVLVAAGCLMAAWQGWRRYRLLVVCGGLWLAQAVGWLMPPFGTAALVVVGAWLAWRWRAGLVRWGLVALAIGVAAVIVRVVSGS